MRNTEIKVIEVKVVSSNLEKRGKNYNWELCQKITSRSNSTKKLFAMVNIKTNDGNSGAVKFDIRVFSKFNEESGNAYKYVQMTDTTTKFGTVTVSTSDFIHGKFTQELTINYQYYLSNKRQVVDRVKVKYENKINDVEQELNNEKYEHRQEIKAHDVTKKENEGLKYELMEAKNEISNLKTEHSYISHQLEDLKKLVATRLLLPKYWLKLAPMIARKATKEEIIKVLFHGVE